MLSLSHRPGDEGGCPSRIDQGMRVLVPLGFPSCLDEGMSMLSLSHRPVDEGGCSSRLDQGMRVLLPLVDTRG